MDAKKFLIFALVELFPHCACQRGLTPDGFQLPSNPAGKFYGTIPGIQLPDEEDVPFNGEAPIYPFNALTGIAVDDPQPNFDFGFAHHPVNIMDLPVKELFPIWQAQQLQNGGSPNSYWPDAQVPADRQHLLPGRANKPLTPRAGVGLANFEAQYFLMDGYIDFPVQWGPESHRFRFEGNFDAYNYEGWFKVPVFEVGKFFNLAGQLTPANDYPDFHFGQTLRPLNPLDLNIKEQYATGRPSWAPFANSIAPNARSLAAVRDAGSGSNLFVAKTV